MTSRLLSTSVLLGGVLFVSCVPFPEPGRNDPRKPKPNASVMNPEQQEIQKKKDELKKKEAGKEAKKEKLEKAENDDNPDKMAEANTPPKTETKKDKKDWPYASAIPGKDGFVFSPYNNKPIDVRDIPSGTLVQDPTYPSTEQKRFRVP
jgi:hypothetical protein